MSIFTPEEKLYERIKELSSLYRISSALLGGGELTDILGQVVSILKDAWRFSEDSIVELELDGNHVLSNILPYKTVSQSQEISIDGNIYGFITVHYDESKFSKSDFLEDEQKLLEKVALDLATYYQKLLADKKIAQLQRSLEHTDRLTLLGEITAGIAHELNTPLGNILGFAELIHERTSDKQTRDDSKKVINAAIYSREIVKKLMFFACEMPQHMALIKVVPVIRDALKFLEPNFRKAGITYNFNVSNPELEAQLDSIQLTQVMFNILVNAIYVSPPDSEINVDVKNTNDMLTIEITDQGAGIRDADREKIFEPFFTTKTLGEGSGLGLSVVHGIIKSHKGNIATYPNFPSGTIFRIDLPLKQ